jgi:hypothetical protein
MPACHREALRNGRQVSKADKNKLPKNVSKADKKRIEVFFLM